VVSTASGRATPGRGGSSPGLAITVDDFDLTSTSLLSGEDRDATIRATLKRHRIKAAGFVAGKYVDPDIAPRVLQRWSDDGHITVFRTGISAVPTRLPSWPTC
jgi:peptidoglycan-N-acetylglucosamine deacetylase